MAHKFFEANACVKNVCVTAAVASSTRLALSAPPGHVLPLELELGVRWAGVVVVCVWWRVGGG